VLLWVVGAIARVVTDASRDWAEPPQTYSYVIHHSAMKVADLLMSCTVVAWLVAPVVAAVYGIVCAMVDDHVRRKLPPAPEFPVARIR
jgi:hypothetical protein